MFLGALEEKFPSSPAESPTSSSGSGWSTGKTVLVSVAGTSGAIGGGFLFQIKKIVKDYLVKPGPTWMTGNGTKQFGPSKIEEFTRVEKYFNGWAALGSGLISGLLTFLLCYYVF